MLLTPAFDLFRLEGRLISMVLILACLSKKIFCFDSPHDNDTIELCCSFGRASSLHTYVYDSL